jgi:hypothetical protein
MGYVQLQLGNVAGMRSAFDALRLHDRDPFFYGLDLAKGAQPPRYFARFQIEKDGVRIQPVSHWDPKKGGQEKLECADRVMGAGMLATVRDCGTLVPMSSVRELATYYNLSKLKTDKTEYQLYALNWHEGLASGQGSMASWRALGNRYTRLFARYAGYDGAKLGKEGVSGMDVLFMAMTVAASASGGLASMSSGFSASAIAVTAAMAGAATIQVIQQSRADMRAMFRTERWKSIPLNPAQLAFRLDGI